MICCDLNGPYEYDGPNGYLRARHRTLMSNLGSHFFRADTRPVPTRPANRFDSVVLEGNFLDHIYGANVNTPENDCLSNFIHTSDHNPIVSRVFPDLWYQTRRFDTGGCQQISSLRIHIGLNIAP